MKLLINLVRPKYVIPIHGELRQLKQHALLAQSLGIPAENIPVVENGQVIEFHDGVLRSGPRVPGSYVFVDGSGVGDIGPAVMREREALSMDGVVVVHLIVDRGTGRLRKEPEIVSRGFMMSSESQELFYQATRKIVEASSGANGSLQQDVEKVVRNYLYNETRRSPVVFVTISKV
jgi:ribonuclease J